MFGHDGYLHINYVKSYEKELVALEEFQVFRQVVAVSLGLWILGVGSVSGD